ncbi:MAG TPA: sigma-70 family RNA polymerase sigma factor [Anaerovoracaceae bacterium]|nr:sigma-70 family RNA polymerase sigma factor [Anaerovoracaceae bacterium]
MGDCLTATDQKKEDLESWMRDYGTSLLRLSFLYLRDLHLAEDVVQETMLKAYFRYDDFRRQSSAKTWLTRIAINLCKDCRRSAWFQRVSCEDLIAEIAGPGKGPDPGDVVGNQVEKKYQNQDLLAAIMRLPLKYKEVILLYYYQGFSTKETAGILSVPESTVSTRLRRAKAALKRDLGGWSYD